MHNPSPKIEAANDAPVETALNNPLATDDVMALAHQGSNVTLDPASPRGTRAALIFPVPTERAHAAA